MIAQVYADDIVFGSTTNKLKNEFVEFMHSKFEMSMVGELTYFLGLKIKQCTDGIFLNQMNNAKNMVKKFGMKSSKTVRTPLGQQDKLSTNAEGKDVDQKLYMNHLKAAKRILRYIHGTSELGLWYSKRSSLDVIGFTDSNWAGCRDDQKKVEYVAAGSCNAQLLWNKKMLEDYGIENESFILWCDNTSAINISKNPHIETDFQKADIFDLAIGLRVARGSETVANIVLDKKCSESLVDKMEINGLDPFADLID
ncbi:uncharacterized mitochondrial protein AtMg00810-like [Andrographis paniculata]|uniref:uncharacterized mitochondrial protein AtMg00810-like n=1 Tax=Andrographis paniculata TaxID=175694 RepID=UPI0021E892A7|nr:uncharacterized mitochondrial protein AtMg00810-like [Andrographis paniculata]